MKQRANHPRFEYIEDLGSGATGRVYLAFDRQLRSRVAVKEVGAVSGEWLWRFKQEYRVAQQLAHPNLVSLGELFEHEGEWCFSMELVEGETFLRYARPRSAIESHTELTTSGDAISDATIVHRSEAGSDGATATGPRGAVDLGRARESFAQLIRAVTALHEAGIVHRDLKPSNVLITSQGRVVVLDFGLATALEGGLQVEDVGVMGTPSYMAPEQAAGLPVGPAADWYAVGVMLYEALTGRLPFSGPHRVVLRAKQEHVPVSPESIDPGVDPMLSALAMDLLRIDPVERPLAAEIARRMGAETGDDAAGSAAAHRPADSTFVGRRKEIEILDELGAQVMAKRARQAVIVGESGIGKSELLRHALERTSHRGPDAPWILSSKCRAQERVRFKAFDGILDQLSVALAERIGDEELTAILPSDAGPLARVFPVLTRIPHFERAAERAKEVEDPIELLRKATGALGRLLFRLATRRRVILVVEDLQWADEASFALLRQLTDGEQAPPLLVLASSRPELLAGSSSADAEQFLASPTLTTIHLTTLPRDAARALARSLAEADALDEATLEALVEESGGHPMFLDALVQGARAGLRADAGAHWTLKDALAARIARLPSDEESVVRMAALAGRPTSVGVLARAAEVGAAEVPRLVSKLRRERWLRGSSGDAEVEVEIYHDQITIAALSRYEGADDERRRAHGKLAEALLEVGARAGTVVPHLVASGERSRAAVIAREAAPEAAFRLDFVEASALYEVALGASDLSPEERSALEVARAEALSHAGRGEDAARAYRDAASRLVGPVALELRAKAAVQWISSGVVEQGKAELFEVTRELGLSVPGGGVRTLLALGLLRARLAMRRFERTSKGIVDPMDRLRIDVCWAVSHVFTVLDPALGGYFGAQYIDLALRRGEPEDAAMALGLESVTQAYMGDVAAGLAFHARARKALENRGSSFESTRAAVILALHEAAIEAIRVEDFDRILSRTTQAQHRLRKIGRDHTWEGNTARMVEVVTMAQCGDFVGVDRVMEHHLRHAESVGDRFGWVSLIAHQETATRHLVRDDPDELDRVATESWKRLGDAGFFFLHLSLLFSRTRAALYRGSVDAAYALFREREGTIRSSVLLQMPATRAMAAQEASGIRLALCAASGRAPTYVERRRLRTDLAAMAKVESPYFEGHRLARRAALAHLKGSDEDPRALLESAATKYDEARARAYGATMRFLVGQLWDDTRAREDRARGLKYLVEQNVRDPERFVAVVAPGFRPVTMRETRKA